MIPKTIHYCWFGKGEKNRLFKICLASWKRHCPDYRIIEWNESNYDIDQSPRYVREAYQAGKWAFVSDYVRLSVICRHGGVYLDTDVEIIRPIDRLLMHPAFFGTQPDNRVATGLGFGSVAHTRLLEAMLKDYETIPFVLPDGTFDISPCASRNKHAFAERGLVCDGNRQVLSDGTLILEPEALCPINFWTNEKQITVNTLAIHWYSASWHENKKPASRLLIRLLGHRAFANAKCLWHRMS